LGRAKEFLVCPDSKPSSKLTGERMVLSVIILVVSTALSAFFLLVTVQRILRTAIRRK